MQLWSPYYLLILDIEEQTLDEVNGGSFSRKDDKYTFYGFNILIKNNGNNKYLFARYANSFDIYDINDIDNIKCIYTINREQNLSKFPIDFESLCNYEIILLCCLPKIFINSIIFIFNILD